MDQPNEYAAAMKIENGGKIETGQTDTVWK
jgi:hypothetical protein